MGALKVSCFDTDHFKKLILISKKTNFLDARKFLLEKNVKTHEQHLFRERPFYKLMFDLFADFTKKNLISKNFLKIFKDFEKYRSEIEKKRPGWELSYGKRNPEPSS